MSDTVLPVKTPEQIAQEGQPNLVDVLGITETVQSVPKLSESDTGYPFVDLIRMSEEQAYTNAAAQSADPVAFMNRYKASMAMQPYYPRLTVHQIFNNYESLAEDYWGRAQEPTESTIKTMWDSWQAGVNLYLMGKAGFGLSISKLVEGMGMKKTADYMAGGFEEAITDLKGRIEGLNVDNVQDPKAIRTWLKTLAGTAPSVFFGMGEAVLGGALGKAVTAGTGLAKQVQLAGETVTAGQVLKTMAISQRVAQGATFAQGWATLQGLDFIEMRDRGIDDRIALPVSMVTGALNQIVEQSLGFEVGASKLFDKVGIVNLTDKIVSRIHGKGILQSAAMNLASRGVISTLGETSEEVLQALNTGVGTLIAQEISKAIIEDGTIRDPATVASISKDIKESFLQTLSTAWVLGVPANIISTVHDQKSLRDMVSSATRQSKSAFTQKMGEAMPFEGVSREETIRMAETIYDQKMQDEADVRAEVQKAYEAAKAKPTEGQIGTESRLETGALRVESSDLGANDELGGRDYSYDVAAAQLEEGQQKAEKYGHIEVNEQGNTLTLLSANFKTERAGLIDEALGELIAQNPGKLIEISANAQADPFLAGAFERYQNIKWAQDTTKSVPDESMKNVHREQLMATRKMSPGQAEATIGLMQTFANTAKMSYSDFWQPLKEIRIGAETEVGAGNIGKIKFFDNGQEVSSEGLKKLAQSVIYVSENESNANVITHELTHFGRVQMSAMSPETLKGIEEVYGITDGMWKREDDERLANEFMSFVAHGTLDDERKKPFFDRLRDIIRAIWPHIKKLALSPEVENIFKTWFSEPITVKETVSDLDSQAITVSERYNVTQEDTKISKNKTFSDTDLLSEEGKKIIDDNLKEMNQDTGLNMTKGQMYEGGEDINKMASNDAKDYDSVEEWVERGLGYKFDSLNESDKVWFKSRFNWAKENKARQYAKTGDFYTMLMSGRNMNDFLYAIDRAISSGSKDYMQDTRRAKRIRDAISKSPTIVKAMDELIHTGIIPSDLRSKLNAYVKRNEDLVMFLYAEVSGDVDLAQEALSNLKELPEINKAEFIQRPGMTLADQAIIYRAITDDNLRAKVVSGAATIEDILAYEKTLIRKGNEAIEAQRKSDQAVYRERLALVRLKEQMRKERKYILSQPSAHIDNTYLQILLLMKQYLRGGQKLDLAKMRALSSVVFRENPGYAETFIGIIDSIGKKDFKKWTIDELRQVSTIMKGLIDIGRVIFDKNKYIRDIEIKKTREDLESKLHAGTDYQENLKKYKGVPAPGSTEEEELDADTSKRVFGVSAGRPDAVFKDIDRTGTMKKILWEQAEVAKSNEYSERDRRTRAVLDFIKENDLHKIMNDNIVIKDIGQDGTPVSVTRGQLLGARALMGRGDKFNQIQRERFIYGTLFSSEYKEGRHEQEMKDVFSDKVSKMEAAFDKHISDKQEQLVQMILDVFDNADDKTRFIHAMLEISGREIMMESYYFPIRMQSELADREDNIVDSIVKENSFFKSLLADGFTYDRRPNLRPSSNKRIEYDLMSLFLGGIERQEHLINMGVWAKDMKSIFTHVEYSAGINEALRMVGGTHIQRYIGDFIEAAVNPNGYKTRGNGVELIKTMRGKVMSTMLAWRVSTFLVQMATSPMIGIAYCPGDFLKTVLKAYTSGNPIQWYKSIEEKSAILRNRQLDPFIGRLKDLYEKGALGKGGMLAELGFRYLNFADRFSCAIVWESIYQNNLKKSNENGDPIMTDAEAVHQADMVILQTQPSSDDMFRSPLYRDVESWKAVLLQFTQPLNVIWNQLRYDVPEALRERELGRFFGVITSYALSGLAIGLIKMIPVVGGGGGPPEGADKEELERYFASYLFSQFTDSIPIIGSDVTVFLRQLITGDQQIRMGNNVPLANYGIKLAGDIAALLRNGTDATSKQWHQILYDGAITAGLITGSPTLSLKELMKGFYEWMDRAQ